MNNTNAKTYTPEEVDALQAAHVKPYEDPEFLNQEMVSYRCSGCFILFSGAHFCKRCENLFKEGHNRWCVAHALMVEKKCRCAEVA